MSAQQLSQIEQINHCLPQTQCGECGYGACLPYAEAIVNDNAPLDRCPPGGVAVVKKLAQLQNRDPEPYLASIQSKIRPPQVAYIQEEACIGCTKCIQACPVDAIIGATKQLHTVFTQDCTGCELCLPACPVDCIVLHPVETLSYSPQRAKQYYEAKKSREEKIKTKITVSDKPLSEKELKLNYIKAALARANAKKQGKDHE